MNFVVRQCYDVWITRILGVVHDSAVKIAEFRFRQIFRLRLKIYPNSTDLLYYFYKYLCS